MVQLRAEAVDAALSDNKVEYPDVEQSCWPEGPKSKESSCRSLGCICTLQDPAEGEFAQILHVNGRFRSQAAVSRYGLRNYS